MEVEHEHAGIGPSSAQQAHTSITRQRDRLPYQLRTLVSELSLLSRCDGSAKFSHDGSSVVAAVHGPRLAKPRLEDSEKAIVEVVYKPRAGIQGHQEREYEHIIRRTLEGIIILGMHPRTSIMVVLQEILCDGSMLSCALNAACAALVDAGVPMNSMFSSVTCAVHPDGTLLLDPDSLEEQAAQLVVSMAFAHHCAVQGVPQPGQTTSVQGASEQITTDRPQEGIKVASGALMCHTWPGEGARVAAKGGSGSSGVKSEVLLDCFDNCAEGCGKVGEFLRSALRKALAT